MVIFILLFMVSIIIFPSSSIFSYDSDVSELVVFDIRKMPNFTKIVIRGSGELVFSDIDQEIIKIEAEKGVMPQIETKVTDGILVIQDNGNVYTTKPIKYYLAIKEITDLSAHGSVKVSNKSLLKINDLTVTASGASNINLHQIFGNSITLTGNDSAVIVLKGSVNSQNVMLAGAANYEGMGLLTKNTIIKASGTSQAIVRAEKNIDVTASGLTIVEYYGEPRVTKDITPPARLKKLQAERLISLGL